VKLFVTEVLYKDLGMIADCLMFANLSVTFVMFLLCYAQCLIYLLLIVFPFLDILQHYAKFNIRTIITLEKLLGGGSFSSSICRLACCQIVLLVFSSGFNFLSMV
jgi:hypothetical protein